MHRGLKHRVSGLRLQHHAHRDVTSGGPGGHTVVMSDKENIDLSKNSSLIKKFAIHLLSHYAEFKLGQISIAFVNLFAIDNFYASELILNLDSKILAKKANEIIDSEKLKSWLGEIKTVNHKFWEQLQFEIDRQKGL